MSKIEGASEEQCWFVYVNQEAKGPMALRDLDVLLRTNQINSRAFCWKNGMKEWKPLIEVQQIKQSILQLSEEKPEVEKKNVQPEQSVASKPKEQTGQQPDQQDDHMIENQDENPLAILEVTVQNLIKKTFHQTEDGKWSIYDQQKQSWVLQDEEPIQKINQMKNFLLNKLKSQFFADDKNKRKYKQQNIPPQEPQKPLTKQQLERKERNKKKTKRAAQKKKQKWYQAKINTFIYISGLPFDIVEEEIKDFASRAGVLRIDLTTGKEKIKIYRDQNNLPKGDAAVSYAREQSVDIALDMLNGSEIRDGFIVKVQKAHFNQKDQQYKKRETKKQTKVKKALARKNEEKMLGWDQQNEDKGEGFRIVIMKHVFIPQQANIQAEMSEIKSDITAELGKIGEIKRIRFFETHPDGVVQIKFEKDVDAQKCIQIMNGRFFDGRQIVCEYWDGQIDYKLDANSLLLQEERLQKYASQIEQGHNKNSLEKIDENNEQDANDEIVQARDNT